MLDLILLLVLIQIKHFIIDFPLQTQEHLKTKGLYGNLTGFSHSVFHGLGTFFVFCCIHPDGATSQHAFIMGMIDTVVHYHIDWIKTRFGNKDIAQKAFWTQLGLDQLGHQLTYALLIYLYFHEIGMV